MREVSIPAFAAARADGAFAIDVREPYEYEERHVPGVMLVPMSQVLSRLHEVPRGRPVFVICATGNRSLTVAEALVDAGYDAWSVAGGTTSWEQAGKPVVRGAARNVA